MNYPGEYIEKISLADGTQVTIRPILPEDAPGLQEAFSRLSPQSVYLRFLETFKQLTDKQAQELAELDYQKRMALVAEVVEQGEKHLVGVARYAMLDTAHAESPQNVEGVAESAIVVVDEYQGRGLGTILLERLVMYAREHGVQAFMATVHHSNARIMRFIQRSGFISHKRMLEPGVWEIVVTLGKGAWERAE
jgi:acetyltransferase